MKNLKSLLFLLVALTMTTTFVSCSDDDDDNSILDNIVGKFSATVGGEAWKADAPYAQMSEDKIKIFATNTDGNIMNITLFGTEAQSYEITGDSLTTDPKGDFIAIYKESASTGTDDIYTSYKGTVTISAIDAGEKKISGTFSFSMIKPDLSTKLEITSGSFENINYTGVDAVDE